MILASLILGILPAAIWLAYFIKKDLRPEPKRLLLKIFFLGMMATLPALLIESSLEKNVLANFLSKNSLLYIAINYFFIVALSEEILKFLAVKIGISHHPEFDEPIDGMIYLITAAMGFATMENLLTNAGIALGQAANAFDHIIFNTVMRFYGPTFLHALCSAIVGYFFAMSFFKKKKFYTFFGLCLAILLHGLFNYLIILNEIFSLFSAFILLAIMVFFVSKILFKRVKREQIRQYKF